MILKVVFLKSSGFKKQTTHNTINIEFSNNYTNFMKR